MIRIDAIRTLCLSLPRKVQKSLLARPISLMDSTTWTAIKTLLFTVLLVMGVVTIGIPYLILKDGPTLTTGNAISRWPALLVICAGAAIYAWCAFSFTVRGRGTPAPFDPPTQLVAHGLYRFSRNPMYIGVLTILAGEALLFRSALLAIYTGAMAVAFHLRVVFFEERVLRKQFGESYDSYCRHVPRWIPGLKGISLPG